jgi:hypothetical protein
MGTGYENRARMCWQCKFFINHNDQYRNGVCVAKAPQKIDEKLGTGPSPYTFFQEIIDSENGFCGDYVPALIPATGIIPPIQPES